MKPTQEDLEKLETIYLEIESQVEKFRAILDALIDQAQGEEENEN